MAWENINLKDNDRIAQAGIALVEQALLADATTYPPQASGNLKLNSRDGKVQIDNPTNEFVKNKLQADHDGTTIYLENIASFTDASGRTVQTIDQQQAGDFLATNVTNKINNKTIVRGADGSLQYQMMGQSGFTPKDGVFRDDTLIITDGNGNQLPLQLHLTAQAKGSMIDILATTTLADADGKQIVDANGKPTILGTVEAIVNVNTTDKTAQYKLLRTGAPLVTN